MDEFCNKKTQGQLAERLHFAPNSSKFRAIRAASSENNRRRIALLEAAARPLCRRGAGPLEPRRGRSPIVLAGRRRLVIAISKCWDAMLHSCRGHAISVSMENNPGDTVAEQPWQRRHRSHQVLGVNRAVASVAHQTVCVRIASFTIRCRTADGPSLIVVFLPVEGEIGKPRVSSRMVER